MPFHPFFPAFLDLLISLGQRKLAILRLKSGPNLGPRRVILYSPIKLLEFSFYPIRTCSLDSCCCFIQKEVDEELEFLQLRWIYFVSTEEHYCLNGMHFSIYRSVKHHSCFVNVQAL